MASQKETVALISVAASAVLTLAKAGVGAWSGSLAILAEAGHSLLDFGATLITYFAIRVADRPADENHPYGHGKAEPIAALAEALLLFLLSGLVIAESVRRLINHEEGPPVTLLMVGVIVAAIVIDAWRAYRLHQAAKETHSAALAADALHFMSDLVSSAVVLVGLAGVWLGYPQADALAAALIALLVCVLGWRLGRSTVNTLMDQAPLDATEQVKALARTAPGIVSLERVRLRSQGSSQLADIEVNVSRALPLDQVARMKADLAERLRSALPLLGEANIIAHPVALDDESIMERVHIIARHEAVPIHHVTVQHVDERLAIAFDMEIDGDATLRDAHQIATRIEDAVRAELGPSTEVEAHIEPLQVESLTGSAASAQQLAQIAGQLGALVSDGPLSHVHDVRVRETPAGLIVNYHCRAPELLPVRDVHEAVDDLDRRLRVACREVVRVVGHAEPLASQPSAVSA